MYLKKGESNLCTLCKGGIENTPHLILHCSDSNIQTVREKYFSSLTNLLPKFRELNDKMKLSCILNLFPYDRDTDHASFQSKCIEFLNCLVNVKFPK